ncbi:MAG: hypothetical protein ACFE0I_09715 [Elainellaceae cyanobacterium]
MTRLITIYAELGFGTNPDYVASLNNYANKYLSKSYRLSKSNTGATFIRWARSLTTISVCKLQTNPYPLYQPVMVALAASAMALYPMKGLHANPGEDLDGINSLETSDRPIPEARQPFTPSPEPTLIQKSRPEISPDFSPDSSPNSSYASTPDVRLQTSLDSPALSSDGLSESPAPSIDTPSATTPEDISPEILEASLEPSSETSSENSPAFGSRGLQRWYVQGGGATTFENNFGLAGAGVSHFFANGHSVNLEPLKSDYVGFRKLNRNLHYRKL